MKRRPLQGVRTVVRFNWHFFAGAAAAIAVLSLGARALSSPASELALAAAIAASVAVFISLFATFIAYDATGLYSFAWLDHWMRVEEPPGRPLAAANIHAGFDETSELLAERYPVFAWSVFDFFDAAKHTEISIRRARAAHPPRPDTVALRDGVIPRPDASFDRILLILAAHEIRDHAERAAFFRELRRAVRPGGLIIVTEHLRDPANLLAYNLGAWHFHTPAEWLATFADAGLEVVARRQINPFVTTFVLRAS